VVYTPIHKKKHLKLILLLPDATNTKATKRSEPNKRCGCGCGGFGYGGFGYGYGPFGGYGGYGGYGLGGAFFPTPFYLGYGYPY